MSRPSWQMPLCAVHDALNPVTDHLGHLGDVLRSGLLLLDVFDLRHLVDQSHSTFR